MNRLQTAITSRIKNIHFIGIGGSGMSGIAEVLHNLGYQVSGSDINHNPSIQRLQDLGCLINNQHSADNVVHAQAVVISSAIQSNNVEIIKAHTLNIPIVPRAEMLAEIMRFRFGIAIAGTHGKTTTTSLITHILTTAKLDPTYIIGGILNSSGSNAKLGESDYLIAEADESDGSFLHLQPMLSVITNIDQDHMATYDNDYQKLTNAFVSFVHNLPFYGVCVLCIDDRGVKNILDDIHRPLVTYGFDKSADVRAINIKQVNRQMQFEVVCDRYQQSFCVILNLIGKHNILNTLAAISVACEMKVKIEIIQNALTSFTGVARRLDYHGELSINYQKITLFDDYGHHPNEINAVFASLRNTYPSKRLLVIFQPHRYSRTRDLFDDFAHTLSQANALILLSIYPANEKPIAHINANTLANAIRQRSALDPIVVKNADEALKILPNVVKDSDIVLTLGAGNIHNLMDSLLQKYAHS